MYSEEIYNFENRPFHQAYLEGILPCPGMSCKSDSAEAFSYRKRGLDNILEQNILRFPLTKKNTFEMHASC